LLFGFSKLRKTYFIVKFNIELKIKSENKSLHVVHFIIPHLPSYIKYIKSEITPKIIDYKGEPTIFYEDEKPKFTITSGLVLIKGVYRSVVKIHSNYGAKVVEMDATTKIKNKNEGTKNKWNMPTTHWHDIFGDKKK
jgi:hypothetical protein